MDQKNKEAQCPGCGSTKVVTATAGDSENLEKRVPLKTTCCECNKIF